MKVLLLSARLSQEAIGHLLKETSAGTVIATERLVNSAKAALANKSEAPSQILLVAQEPYGTFLNPRNTESPKDSIVGSTHYRGELDRNVLLLHSSGTTGLPKAISCSHRYLLFYATCSDFRTEDEALGWNITTLPLYHGFGLVAPALALGCGKTFCIPPPKEIPSGLSTIQFIRRAGARSLMSVPSILEDICQLPDDEGMKTLAKLDFVACGGGPLKPSVGEKLADAGVQIVNSFGTTETGPLTVMFVPDEAYDWHYFRLRTDVDLELVQDVRGHLGDARYTLRMRPFGWKETFQVNDQMVQNSRIPKTDFRAIGRSDDLLVLANGEKVSPSGFEAKLAENDHFRAALAFGDGKSEIGLLAEPAASSVTDDLEQFKELLWPDVLRLNETLDKHARIISKDLMIVVAPGSVPRSDKGAVVRREAYKKFSKEIAHAYAALGMAAHSPEGAYLRLEELETELTDLIGRQFQWNGWPASINIDSDLFELGIDSLQATQLRRTLASNAKHLPGAALIQNDFIYRYSTVRKIAAALRQHQTNSTDIQDRDAIVERFILANVALPERKVILLTGSTGSLGAHLLAKLVSDPGVSQIVCLNRVHAGQSARERLLKSLREKRLGIHEQHWNKVKLLESNIADERLGLDEEEYTHLRQNITHVIHNAWPVDFKRTLLSFDPHFRGLRNLLDLVQRIKAEGPLKKARLVFVSSIAVVGHYAEVHGGRLVPEQPVDSVACVNRLGYAEAKFICEKMIERTLEQEGAPAELAYVRVGQMSGSAATGYWNQQEHFPALVKSAQKLGALPKIKGTLSWLPVDQAAASICELTLCRAAIRGAYHLENPVRQSWHDVLCTLAERLNLPPTALQPYNEWLSRVRSLVKDDDSASMGHLLEFFEQDFQRMSSGGVLLDTAAMRAISGTLKMSNHVSDDTLACYVDYWRRSGFLEEVTSR